MTNADCTSPLDVCNLLTNICVECTENINCTLPTPACNIITNTCAECIQHSDCSGPLGFCSPITSQCVECTENSQCTVFEGCINSECVVCIPNPPVGLFSFISGPDLIASWVAVVGAISYTIRYEETANPPFAFAEWTGIVGTTLTSSTPTSGVPPSTICSFNNPFIRIKAITVCGESGFSGTAIVGFPPC